MFMGDTTFRRYVALSVQTRMSEPSLTVGYRRPQCVVISTTPT